MMANEHVEQLRRIADEIANSQRPVEQEAEWLRAAATYIEELEKRPAVPVEIMELVRWLAGAYWDVYDAMMEHDPATLIHFPLIQGTRQQIKLRKIGNQECDITAVPAAVEWMLAAAIAKAEADK